MTAFAMVRMTDRIITAADGAVYMPSGHVAGFKSKMLHLPNVGAVLTCQGPAALLPYVNMMLVAKVRGFDDVLELAPAAVRHAYEEVVTEIHGWGPFYLAIGGYSEARQRFETYYVRSIDREEGGPYGLPGNAWELMPAPEFFAAPWPGDEACARVNCETAPPPGPHLIDSELFALKAVAGGRFEPCGGEHGMVRGRCYVGGFIELALTMRDFSQARIVHRWPDRLNELIDPDDGEPLPAELLAQPVFIPVPADTQS